MRHQPNAVFVFMELTYNVDLAGTYQYCMRPVARSSVAPAEGGECVVSICGGRRYPETGV